MRDDEQSVMKSGRVFQARGPATANARSPSVVRRITIAQTLLYTLNMFKFYDDRIISYIRLLFPFYAIRASVFVCFLFLIPL